MKNTAPPTHLPVIPEKSSFFSSIVHAGRISTFLRGEDSVATSSLFARSHCPHLTEIIFVCLPIRVPINLPKKGCATCSACKARPFQRRPEFEWSIEAGGMYVIGRAQPAGSQIGTAKRNLFTSPTGEGLNRLRILPGSRITTGP